MLQRRVGWMPGRARTGAARDLVGLCVAGLGLLGLAAVIAWNGVMPQDDAYDLLVLGAVGLGAAAALLGDVAGRLSGDVRPSWIAAALALYTLVVTPSSSIWPEMLEDSATVLVAERMAAYTVILALLVVAVRPPVHLGHWAPWLGAGAGVLLVVGTAQGAVAFPHAFATPGWSSAMTAIVLLAWLLASGWLVIGGLRRRDPTVWWMGLGLLLVAVAHEYRIVAGIEFDEPDLTFGVIRLLGMLTVLVGTLQLVRGGVHAVLSEQEELQANLWVAATHLERACANAAERDHEVRNGLMGLTGITQLLGRDSGNGDGNTDQEQLRTAVLHELARLAAMLERDRPAATGRDLSPLGCDVTQLLTEAVMLRRAAGTPIELDSPPELRTVGPPGVLAQVISNLLANCERHAPGAAVRVRARTVGNRIVIEVADDGPGIGRGRERIVLDRGIRDPESEGDGLGLFVARRLLDGVHGSLRLLPSGQRGCTAVVELPRLVPTGVDRNGSAAPMPVARVPQPRGAVEPIGRRQP